MLCSCAFCFTYAEQSACHDAASSCMRWLLPKWLLKLAFFSMLMPECKYRQVDGVGKK